MNFLCVVSFAIAVILTVVSVESDDSPGFFLKVTKNVPRLGRRSANDFEKYFRKASKSVPRIGRRSEIVEPSNPDEGVNYWYDRLINPTKKAKTHIGFYAYNVVKPLDSNTILELLANDLLPTDQLKFVPWKDFDDALQQDEDLYVKVMSLGKDPNIELKNDLSFKKFVPSHLNGENNDFVFFNNGQNLQMSDAEREKLEYQF